MAKPSPFPPVRIDPATTREKRLPDPIGGYAIENEPLINRVIIEEWEHPANAKTQRR